MANINEIKNLANGIRQITYGIDNREPIADTLEWINDRGVKVKRVLSVDSQVISGSDESYSIVFHCSGDQ